ncbi:MAG: hypothetical protein WA317_01535 [Mycobacterium sp.]|uniref:hypothetical protein n=1 Tax=Mycobacterium sp. TaxID=1785 RepID=UPI003CC6920B
MEFFGERWDAPVCDDARQVSTPVGEPCWRCEELIVEGDQGFVQPLVRVVGDVVLVCIHRACMVAEVCGCTGFDRSHASALEAQRRFVNGER